MEYGYTAYYKTDEDRIKAIVEDILREYPNLGNLATEAAKLEKPFGAVHEDYSLFSYAANCINRLIDIVIVTEGKPEYQDEYEKACKELIESYNSWRRNFTYSNPEEQAEYVVMQRFFEHMKDSNARLITVKEASDIIRAEYEEEKKRIQWQVDHTMKYEYTAYYENEDDRIKAIVEDILREYPNLGNLATEAAKLEKPFGAVHEDYSLFSYDSNCINRLIDIVMVTEGKPEYQEEYEKASEDLMASYNRWRRNFTYSNPEEQPEYLVMQAFFEHIKDNSKPLITIKEASESIRKR